MNLNEDLIQEIVEGNLAGIGLVGDRLDHVAISHPKHEGCEYSKAVMDCLDKGLSTANVHSELSCAKSETFQHGLCRDCLHDRFSKSGIRGILK